MKECSRDEVLKVKKSQYDPPYQSRSGGLGGKQDQGHGAVLHDKGEEYQKPITPRNGSSKRGLDKEVSG